MKKWLPEDMILRIGMVFKDIALIHEQYAAYSLDRPFFHKLRKTLRAGPPTVLRSILSPAE
jgi:hypothetical protein